MRCLLTSLSAIALCTLNADVATIHPTPPPQPKVKQPEPWFTGPLLTPSGNVIPKGHWNLEPYEFVNANFGVYDHRWHTHSVKHNFYNVNTELPFQYGFAKRWDVAFTPQFSWNHIDGASHWVLNDLPFQFDYQLVTRKMGKWWPSIKLSAGLNFPLGRYQKLNPKSKFTDLGGSGSWSPFLALSHSHLFWWGGHIYFAPRLSFSYSFPTPVHVKGLNAYGGGHHTNGRAYPGQKFIGLFGFEISLSQRWVLANDFMYLHLNHTRFKGHKGKTAGVPNHVGYPSLDQWSMAPAIEYNFTPYVGIIGGVWFSLAARNSPEFANAVVAVNIYH